MNEPDVIYLQVGDEYDEKTDSFRECEEVTWCTDSQNGNDLEYCRISPLELSNLRSIAEQAQAYFRYEKFLEDTDMHDNYTDRDGARKDQYKTLCAMRLFVEQMKTTNTLDKTDREA